MKKIPLFVLSLGLGLGRLHAQVELYPFPDLEEIAPKKTEARPANPFVQALARKFNVPEKILSEATDKGFGREELIRLILISKKSSKPLEDLIEERQKGARLAKIAKSAGQDNKQIRQEAGSVLKEVEAEEKGIREEIMKSSAPTAGVSRTGARDGAGYEADKSTDSSKKR